ncbi:hypothetical protein, partial [Citrobacter freundii]|uniref:hypothetical protein n=1 Tax=Citrobacter freundii TaxID=546 RepID=UPI00334E37CC
GHKTLEKPLYTNHSEYSQYQEYFALLVGDSAQIMKKRVFTQPVPKADIATSQCVMVNIRMQPLCCDV